MDIDRDDLLPWLHGSPASLSQLHAGSTITQDERLARVFSHQPSLVSVEDDGTVYHNGRREGILYRVAENLREDDLAPVPGSTLPAGKEWLTRRPVNVVAIARVPLDPDELLTEHDENEFVRRLDRMSPSKG